MREGVEARHHSYLLLELLYLPHRFYGIDSAGAKVRHVAAGSGRLERGRIRIHAKAGCAWVVAIVHFLCRLWTIRVHIAPATATASGLLERPSAALELVTAIGRIEVAAILEASLVSAGRRAGRRVGLLTGAEAGGRGAEEGHIHIRSLRLRRKWGATGEVASALDGLDDLGGEGLFVCGFAGVSAV